MKYEMMIAKTFLSLDIYVLLKDVADMTEIADKDNVVILEKGTPTAGRIRKANSKIF